MLNRHFTQWKKPKPNQWIFYHIFVNCFSFQRIVSNAWLWFKKFILFARKLFKMIIIKICVCLWWNMMISLWTWWKWYRIPFWNSCTKLKLVYPSRWQHISDLLMSTLAFFTPDKKMIKIHSVRLLDSRFQALLPSNIKRVRYLV
jgi:hypothetical protein